MVAGLTNTDHQTKILAEATTLVTLQQKFNRLVSLEMTDHSTPHFNSTMHHTTVVNMQRSDRKKQSREVKISPTPQYVQPFRECRRYSHPSRSMNCKDCPTAKMACFNYGIFGHMEKVCRKPKGGSANRSAASAAKEESHIFATRRCTKQPRRRKDQSGRVNQRGKANATQPKAIPHLVWNGDKFQRGFLDTQPFLTITVVPMPEAHKEFGHLPIKANSFWTHCVTAIADTRAQTCSCGPEEQKALGYPDEYLIPSTNQIQGITKDPLDIRGVMFACIRVGSKETRQAIYVSEKHISFICLNWP